MSIYSKRVAFPSSDVNTSTNAVKGGELFEVPCFAYFRRYVVEGNESEQRNKGPRDDAARTSIEIDADSSRLNEAQCFSSASATRRS